MLDTSLNPSYDEVVIPWIFTTDVEENANSVKNILEGLKIREMPIYNRKGEIIKTEYLSYKDGISTYDYMKEIDNDGKKSELFKSVFSRVLVDLNGDIKKNASINIGTKELLDYELIEYIVENNIFSNRTVVEVLEEDFEGEYFDKVNNK